MTTNRRFAAFDATGREGLGTAEIPKDGLCISAFLVIAEDNEPERVLVGRINPKAPWDHFGAINQGRLEKVASGWMLPSSHLILLESPGDAAKRILREQLEMEDSSVRLTNQPVVFSDVHDGAEHHWDIGFIYRGSMSREDIPKNSPKWRELRFVDFESTPRSDFARFHDEVIDYSK
jgi:ADP-ribose pyrophosphatase YjhB (NUDIX family)